MSRNAISSRLSTSTVRTSGSTMSKGSNMSPLMFLMIVSYILLCIIPLFNIFMTTASPLPDAYRHLVSTNSVININNSIPTLTFTAELRCPYSYPTDYVPCDYGQQGLWYFPLETLTIIDDLVIENISGGIYNSYDWKRDETSQPDNLPPIIDQPEIQLPDDILTWSVFTWQKKPLFFKLVITFKPISDYQSWIDTSKLVNMISHNIYLFPRYDYLISLDPNEPFPANYVYYTMYIRFIPRIVDNTNALFNGHKSADHIALDLDFSSGFPDYSLPVDNPELYTIYDRSIDITLSGPQTRLIYDYETAGDSSRQYTMYRYDKNIVQTVNCWIDNTIPIAAQLVKNDSLSPYPNNSSFSPRSQTLRLWPYRVLYQQGTNSTTILGQMNGIESELHKIILSSSFHITCSDKYHYSTRQYHQVVDVLSQHYRQYNNIINDDKNNNDLTAIDRDFLNPRWTVQFGYSGMESTDRVKYIQYQPDTIPLFDYNQDSVASASSPSSSSWDQPIIPITRFSALSSVYSLRNIPTLIPKTTYKTCHFRVGAMPFIPLVLDPKSSDTRPTSYDDALQGGPLVHTTEITIPSSTLGFVLDASRGDHVLIKITPYFSRTRIYSEPDRVTTPPSSMLSYISLYIPAYIEKYSTIPEQGTQPYTINRNKLLHWIIDHLDHATGPYFTPYHDDSEYRQRINAWLWETMMIDVAITYVYNDDNAIQLSNFKADKWIHPTSSEKSSYPAHYAVSIPRDCSIDMTHTVTNVDQPDTIPIITKRTFYQRTFCERIDENDDHHIDNNKTTSSSSSADIPSSAVKSIAPVSVHTSSPSSFAVQGSSDIRKIIHGESHLETAKFSLWLPDATNDPKIIKDGGIRGSDLYNSQLVPSITFVLIDSLPLLESSSGNLSIRVYFHRFKNKNAFLKDEKPTERGMIYMNGYIHHNILQLYATQDVADSYIKKDQIYNALSLDIAYNIDGTASSIWSYKDYSNNNVATTNVTSYTNIQSRVTDNNDILSPTWWEYYNTTKAALIIEYGPNQYRDAITVPSLNTSVLGSFYSYTFEAPQLRYRDDFEPLPDSWTIDPNVRFYDETMWEDPTAWVKGLLLFLAVIAGVACIVCVICFLACFFCAMRLNKRRRRSNNPTVVDSGDNTPPPNATSIETGYSSFNHNDNYTGSQQPQYLPTNQQSNIYPQNPSYHS